MLKKLFLVLGWILFVGVFFKIGLNPLTQSFSQIGWRYSWLIGLAFTYYLAYTAAWYYVLPPGQRGRGNVTLRMLFRIRMIGEAINNLTPFGSFGGEGARIYYLRKKLATPLVTASLVLDKTFYFLTAVIFVALSVAIAFLFLNLSVMLKSISIAVLAGLVVSGAGLVWLQQGNAVKKISTFMHRRGWAVDFFNKIIPKIHTMEAAQKEFYQSRPKDFCRVLFLHFLGRLGGTLEIWLILFLTGAFAHIPVAQQFVYSLLIAGFVIVLNIVFFMFPSQIGVAEGATALLFSLMGQPPSLGVLLQLVKRIKNLFFMGLGLFLMGKHSRSFAFSGESAPISGLDKG